MAINPGKLKTLVDLQAGSPRLTQIEVEDDDELDDDEEDAAPADPLERGNALLDEWGEFGQALRETADLLAENAHEVGAVDESDPDAMERVEEVVERMPEEMQAGFAELLSQAAPEDFEAVATAICDIAENGGVEGCDPQYVKGFLELASKYAAGGIASDDPNDVPDPDEDAMQMSEQDALTDEDPAEMMA